MVIEATMKTPLRTDYDDGGQVPPAPGNIVAIDMVAISESINSLPLAPLAATYRPLQGVRSDITSTVAAGFNALPGGIQLTPTQHTGQYRCAGFIPFTSPTSTNINNNNGLADAPNYQTQPSTLEFWSNATTIAVYIAVGGDPADLYALVDDQRLTGDPTMSLVGNQTWTLTQPAAVWRHWRLMIGPNQLFAMEVNAGAVIVATTPGFQAAIIGDSYVQGVTSPNGSSLGVAGFIAAGNTFGELEQITGWDIWRCGIEGTGYVGTEGQTNVEPYGGPTRMTAFNALPPMDLVVVFGSINDSSFTPATVVTAAQSFWSAIATAQPGVPLIVIGPECYGTTVNSAGTIANNNALKTAAQTDPHVTAYIDLIANSFITGTGNEANLVGDGNQDGFIAADSIHPNRQGARYWAQNLADLLGRVPIGGS